MNKKSNSPIEVWDVNDERLPEILTCVPPDEVFISSFEIKQYQPIALNLYEDQYELIFGNRRLHAARTIAAKGGRSTIEVRVFNVDPSQVTVIRAEENSLRSKNEISDYMIIRDLLTNGKVEDEDDRPMNYADIAKVMKCSVSYVKKLDRDWSSIPTGKKNNWILEGVLQGTIGQATAKSLGKLSPEQLKEARQYHSENNKLTFAFVKSMRSITRSSITQGVMEELNLALEENKAFFTRGEIEAVLASIESGADAVYLLRGLLNG